MEEKTPATPGHARGAPTRPHSSKDEAGLEEELTTVLGRGRSERRAGVDPAPGYRKGYGKPRQLTLACGTIEVRRPRARDMEETGSRAECCRCSPRVAARWMRCFQSFMHGLAKGDFELALRGPLGDGAAPSPGSIERLRVQWQADYDSDLKRPRAGLPVGGRCVRQGGAGTREGSPARSLPSRLHPAPHEVLGGIHRRLLGAVEGAGQQGAMLVVARLLHQLLDRGDVCDA